jgi:trimeric autotransporter adhesin
VHVATRTVSAAIVRLAALGFGVLVLAVPAAGALPSGTLQIAPRGQNGVITVNPAGIDAQTGTPADAVCDQSSGDGSCTRLYDPGAKVTLTPSGSTFSGWSDPDCSGTGPCTVTVGTDPRTVVGTFTPLRLQVLVGQNGGGTAAKVTSTPSGVDCSEDCKTKFPAGTTITLHAMPNGHTFTRWAFGCTPNGMDCTVTLTDEPQPVGVSFDNAQPPGQPATIKVSFQVRKRGNGGGTVSGPNGIACPGNCSRQFTFGTALKLDAKADEGSVFTGWGGVCKEETSCTVPVGPVTAISATFEHDTSPPTTPGSISVTAVSKSSVSIGWSASTDNVGVTEYATYLNGSAVGSTTDLAYTFGNLACGTAYEVGVAALDRAGNRSTHATVTATTSPCAASAVTVAVTRVSVKARRIAVVLRVSRATRAHVTLTRGGRKVMARAFALHAGSNTLALTAAPGTYRLTIGVDGAAKVVTRTVVVKRR